MDNNTQKTRNVLTDTKMCVATHEELTQCRLMKSNGCNGEPPLISPSMLQNLTVTKVLILVPRNCAVMGHLSYLRPQT